MNDNLRVAITQDWITIILILCFIVMSLCEYFSKFTFVQSWIRFSKKTDYSAREQSSVPLTFSVIGRIFLYSMILSLFLLEAAHYYLNKNIDFNNFLSYWVIVCTYLVASNYLSKLIAHVCKFENEFDQTAAMHNFQRGLLSYAFFALYVIYYYSYLNVELEILLMIVLSILLINFLILIFRLRWYILSSPLYFILYLCALEIAPYLLLYKYVIE